MKNIRFLLFLCMLVPCSVFGATGSSFQTAAQLLSAARRGDTRTIQFLINAGADINYVDSTGMSLVCTAVMNNDSRAIQVLQMYGADASNCDRQIKNYKRKTNVAAKGEEYGFFSGLPSSHVVALSALGVAAVIGGVALLSDVFDSGNSNGSSSTGSHSGGSGGDNSSSSSGSKDFKIPYGPAYLTSAGVVNANDTSKINDYLDLWSSTSTSIAYRNDFNYMRKSTTPNYISDGLNENLENYLLDMGGYYSLANGYLGQNIHRDTTNNNVPLLPQCTGENIGKCQGRPVRVALITGNGINPAGSADSAGGIFYALSAGAGTPTDHVDKYVNNNATPTTFPGVYDLTEIDVDQFDLSGSGSAFNPFANVNDSALAKIVAGWEEGERSYGDLYGFVPQGQLAIYRTGNGNIWQDVTTLGASVGNFDDVDGDGVLSVGDKIELTGGETFTIQTALSSSPDVVNPTVEINGITYKLASASKMFVAVCDASSGCTSNMAIYVGVGTDKNWYINSDGGDNINLVYAPDDTGAIYETKTLQKNSGYFNFSAMENASSKVDVIANTNVIPGSKQNSYVTVNTFTKFADSLEEDELSAYQTWITLNYGSYGTDAQGVVANRLFSGYSSSTSTTKPIIVMPAGEYTAGVQVVDSSNTLIPEESYFFLHTLDATFENYAPMISSYSGTLAHNFMTIVGVSHTNGTSDATSVDNYGDGTSYGKYRLSSWETTSIDDTTGNTTTTIYNSRMCGLAGVGNAAEGIDPWCFAASGPTAEMATAAAAGAVASVKSAFSYMNNDQIFTLLALTADGPYLNANTDGTSFTTDTLVKHLRQRYEIPNDLIPVGDDTDLSSSEYLNLFRQVYGYGLINLRRAIKPSFSVYYYDGPSGTIISSKGTQNKYWGNAATSSLASGVLSLSGRAAIKISYFDILQSIDGSLSLPRVWTDTIALDSTNSRYGLYMGDVLNDFNVDSSNKRTNKIGNLTIDMSISARAYNDNLNGLDDMRLAWNNDTFDMATEYQHHLTNGESRFNGRANGLLGLVSNSLSADVMYKSGRFGFGGSAFVGSITDENLLAKDPVVSSQFEPGRLGLANGGAMNAKYDNDKFGLNVSFGIMHEDNTVLGMVSDGMLALRDTNTKYVDTVATYKPSEQIKLSLRGTYAITDTVSDGLLITDVSNIKSDSFALGVDVGRFGFTAAMPLAVVDGQLGYGYADFKVVGNNGRYEIAVNDAHTEYIDLSAVKRELRFTTTYKQSLSNWTDAGIGFIYRVNPNNTDAFGNESIFMFKLHHRLGI